LNGVKLTPKVIGGLVQRLPARWQCVLLNFGFQAQSGSVEKKMGCFSDGAVQMSATINTNVCSPGNVTFTTYIHNVHTIVCAMYAFLNCVMTFINKRNAYPDVICFLGDTVSAVGKICNSSSKQMRAKFSLQQRTVYRAGCSTNCSYLSLCKMVGETIAPNSEETVSCQFMVPADVIPSLHNCDIISVDHYLKVCNNVIVMLHQWRNGLSLNSHASTM